MLLSEIGNTILSNTSVVTAHLDSKKTYLLERVYLLSKKNTVKQDGRLGFKCPVDKKFEFPYSVYMVTTEWNHEDNRPENLETLCAICHHLKGMKTGDFISSKKGRKLS